LKICSFVLWFNADFTCRIAKIFRLQGFFRAKNYTAKNTPSEESSGGRIPRQRIFRPNKSITVAKNSPAKNHPSEELSGEELTGEETS
jgi:hypothetical protein